MGSSPNIKKIQFQQGLYLVPIYLVFDKTAFFQHPEAMFYKILMFNLSFKTYFPSRILFSFLID